MHEPLLDAPHVPIATMTHHAYVLRDVINTQKKRILEIGPGDYVVVDYLRRRGREVDTLDLTSDSAPTYVGDIRHPLQIEKKYELAVLSEVLEHAPFHRLLDRLANVAAVLEPDGQIYFSVPMGTWRPFNRNTDLPIWIGHVVEWPLRLGYRLLKGVSPREAIRLPHLPAYDEDNADVHHWDAGYWRSNRKRIRELLSPHYKIVLEKMISFPGKFAANTMHYLIEPKR